MDNSQLRVILLILFLVGMSGFTYAAFDIVKSKNKVQVAKNLAKINKKYNRYNNMIITRNSFRSIVTQLSSMNVYREDVLKAKCVQYYESSMGICLLILLCGIFILQDLISWLILVVLVFVMYDTLVEKRIDMTRRKLVSDLSVAVTSLRDNYIKTMDIPDAVNECTKSSLLQNAFDEIYNILTSNNRQERLDDFCRSTPNELLVTLANGCYVLNESGSDSEEESYSAFNEAMFDFKNRLDQEVRKYTNYKKLFGKLEFLPLVCIFLISPIQSFFIATIPGTASIYRGMVGYIVRIIIVSSALLGYWYVVSAARPTGIRQDDRLKFIRRLLELRWFHSLVEDIAPKKAKQRYMIKHKLSACLSMKDIYYLYASKLVAFTTTFIFTLFASVFIVFASKSFIYNNLRTFTITGDTVMSTVEENRLMKLDCAVIANGIPTDKELTARIKKIFPKMSDLDIDDQAARIRTKYDRYYSIYYRPWYIILCFLLATIAWFIPDRILKLRHKNVLAESKEDVLNMYTIIGIVAHTKLDTLDLIYWMERCSKIHRIHLHYCYHEYPSDPELAIMRLRDNSVLPEFQQICEKMILTISQVSIREAFADLEANRSHILKIREMTHEDIARRKRTNASPLAKLPLWITIFGLVLAPILILGVKSFIQTASQI